MVPVRILSLRVRPVSDVECIHLLPLQNGVTAWALLTRRTTLDEIDKPSLFDLRHPKLPCCNNVRRQQTSGGPHERSSFRILFFDRLRRCRELAVCSDLPVNALIGARKLGGNDMKFMLMMNAPRGTGDWGVMKWSEEDLKAHIRFMKSFNRELQEAGELVGGEGWPRLPRPGSCEPGRTARRSPTAYF